MSNEPAELVDVTTQDDLEDRGVVWYEFARGDDWI